MVPHNPAAAHSSGVEPVDTVVAEADTVVAEADTVVAEADTVVAEADTVAHQPHILGLQLRQPHTH